MAVETSQTLDRGIRVLEALSRTTDGLTVTDLAHQLGMNRTVVHRLVATLELHALVRRTGGRLRIGAGMLQLSGSVLPILRDAAVPVLRELADTLGCTAHLTVADGEEAVALAVVEPTWTDFHVAYRVGSRHPIGHGASGRAIRLLREGDTEHAFVVTTGERHSGAHGLAAPVRDVPGLHAAIGVVTLGAPFDDAVVAPRVVRAAADVAAALA
ncbi:IclR family transcriptional regulator [Nocardioides yefusunii]|uniref:IclR family transcriptional regulator n=1 Tax=Nocardioides yefusunii TaxID=2500546 RepID=A0ABW1QYZ9_9ACTN|nr:helix-turn-helix domain-containing protein [Nocardioides yefusunii]